MEAYPCHKDLWAIGLLKRCDRSLIGYPSGRTIQGVSPQIVALESFMTPSSPTNGVAGYGAVPLLGPLRCPSAQGGPRYGPLKSPWNLTTLEADFKNIETDVSTFEAETTQFWPRKLSLGLEDVRPRGLSLDGLTSLLLITDRTGVCLQVRIPCRAAVTCRRPVPLAVIGGNPHM